MAVLKFMDGYKTILGAIGMVVMALYQLSQAEVVDALGSLFLALLGGGLAHKMVKLQEEPRAAR